MLYCSEAIVLENRDYAEADLIVTYITKEFGIIDLFAKSPRKIRSKFGSSLEPLTYSKITFIGREDKLQRIIQSDIIYPFQKIRENYKLFLKLAEVLRLIAQISPKREKNHELFSLLLNILKELETSSRWENHILYLKIRIMSLLGYLPDLKLCGICGKSLNGEYYYSRGFILCRNCLSKVEREPQGENTHPIPRKIVTFLDSFQKWQISNLNRVKVNEELMNETEEFLRRYIFFASKL